jgi:hypothetical protein
MAAEEVEMAMQARSAGEVAQKDKDASMALLLSELEEQQQRKVHASNEALRWQAELDAFASAYDTCTSAPHELILLARRCAMAVEEIQSLRAQGYANKRAARKKQDRIEEHIAAVAGEELALQLSVSQCVSRVREREKTLVGIKERGAAAVAAGRLKVKGCEQRVDRIIARFSLVKQELGAAKEKMSQGTRNFGLLRPEHLTGETMALKSVRSMHPQPLKWA